MSYLSFESNLSDIVQVQIFQDLNLAAILSMFVLTGRYGLPVGGGSVASEDGVILQRTVPDAQRRQGWKAGMHRCHRSVNRLD